jgi:small-conductance mechanosensitive channel
MSEYLTPTIKVATLIAVGMIAYGIFARGLRILRDREYIPVSIHVVGRGVARWLIGIAITLLALQQFGIPVSTVWGAVSAFAVLIAVGFVAVWSVLSNVLCSILLIVFAPFRIGDEIEIIESTGGTGLRGTVIGLNVLYTALEETCDDGRHCVVQVPNNIFFQKTIRRVRGEQTTSLREALMRKVEV